MDLTEYQKKSFQTATYPKDNWVYPVLGLLGEAGEIADKCKRIIRDDGNVVTPERREQIKLEIGDCLWYIAAVATSFDFDLSELAQVNLDKLASRKQRGVISGEGDNR